MDTDSKINWLHVVLVAIIWIVNLFTGTGLNEIYHVTQYFAIIVYITTFSFVIIHSNRISYSKNNLGGFIGIIVVFLFSSIIHGHGFIAMNYLWVYFLVYVLSHFMYSDRDLFWIGLICVMAGFSVLFIYNYGTFLNGWNENTIAMISFFSYLLFLISFFKKQDKKTFVLLSAISCLFLINIFNTNSRSCIIFCIFVLLFAFRLLDSQLLYKDTRRIIWVILTPLIIALIVVVISKGPYMYALDSWSLSKFEKPFFNGRDVLWDEAFTIFFLHPLLGIGTMSTNNWHNAVITCLVAFGGIGLILWLNGMRLIIDQGKQYTEDHIVRGCLVTFLIIFFQQSFELGLVSEDVNLLPYVILGLMFGRIRFLRNRTISDEG